MSAKVLPPKGWTCRWYSSPGAERNLHWSCDFRFDRRFEHEPPLPFQVSQKEKTIQRRNASKSSGKQSEGTSEKCPLFNIGKSRIARPEASLPHQRVRGRLSHVARHAVVGNEACSAALKTIFPAAPLICQQGGFKAARNTWEFDSSKRNCIMPKFDSIQLANVYLHL